MSNLLVVRESLLPQDFQLVSGGSLQDGKPVISQGADQLTVCELSQILDSASAVEVTFQAIQPTLLHIHVQDVEGYAGSNEFTTTVEFNDQFPKRILFPVGSLMRQWEFVAVNAQVKILDVCKVLAVGNLVREPLTTADKLEAHFNATLASVHRRTPTGENIRVVGAGTVRHRLMRPLDPNEFLEFELGSLAGQCVLALKGRQFVLIGSWKFLFRPGDLHAHILYRFKSGEYSIRLTRVRVYEPDYRATAAPLVWNVQEVNTSEN